MGSQPEGEYTVLNSDGNLSGVSAITISAFWRIFVKMKLQEKFNYASKLRALIGSL